MTNYKALSPQEKLAILTEMGFEEVAPREHTIDCVSIQGSGLICTCYPPISLFRAPAEVRFLMGEDDKTRKEFKAKRDAHEDDPDLPHPGMWIYHTEKIRKEREK